jgi:hypothetical protein
MNATERRSDNADILIYVLLRGFEAEDTRGLPALGYLAGKAEKRALELLADQLRRATASAATLRALADLIDPRPLPPPDVFDPRPPAERCLKFHFRQAGKRKHLPDRGLRISEFIRAEVRGGAPEESAIASAMARFRMKRAPIYEAWAKNKDLAEVLASLDHPKSG